MAEPTDRRPLHIELWPSRDAAQRVAIHSRRPVHAARIFSNRSVDEVLDLLPRLFSVCSIAQAHAARAALSQASGRTLDGTSAADGLALLLLETAREHLWRVLIDWPQFMHEAVDQQAATAMRSLVPRTKAATCDRAAAVTASAASLERLLRDAVFGRPAADWLALSDRQAVHAWCRDIDTTAARLVRRVVELDWEAVGRTTPRCLPELSTQALNERLSGNGADDFVAQPDWCGQPCETTPLSRGRRAPLVAQLEAELGAGLLTRLVALLAELADLPRRLSAAATGAAQTSCAVADAMPDNVGIAQVDAARGRLVHRVAVRDDKVERYQIVAPTEWNFHPRGVLADSLASLEQTDADQCRQQAALLAMTIDPCVDFSVRVH